MKDPIERQDAIDAIKAVPGGNWSSKRYVTAIKELPSAQPEQRPLTEDDYAYCAECDHVEMCRWYPMYGCEFKSRPSAQPDPCEDAVSGMAVEEMLKDLLPERGMWEIEGDEVKTAVCETVRDALEGLWKLPSVTPKLPECEDAVSRKAAIRMFCELLDTTEENPVTCIRQVLDRLPPAQPDIIRCKDCENWDKTWTNDFPLNHYYCPVIDGVRDGNFYCGDAERREG